jgi:CDP-paratose 2-epimerase
MSVVSRTGSAAGWWADAEGPILVTGGAGFLGANLADRLAREGARVTILDSLARPGVERNLEWLQSRHGDAIDALIGDIRDPRMVGQATRDAVAVVHLAAQVAVTTSLADPVNDFEVNARGTLNILEALRRRDDPPPLLFASTNKVYGPLLGAEQVEIDGRRRVPRDARYAAGVDERQSLDLQSPYGCSKGVADQYVLDYARHFGLSAAVFRMSCLYGPRQLGTEDQGWVAHFLLATLRGQGITLYGDGRQVRDILDVEDAVEAYLAALRAPAAVRGRAFNLGGGPERSVSLLEMLEHIRALTGRAPAADIRPSRPGDQLWYVSNTHALTDATGWRPRVSVQDGLARLHGWAQECLARPAPTRQLLEAVQ